ncbi:hypothetical protein ABZY16_35120, partial [Streptomyces sp. NPDC006553]
MSSELLAPLDLAFWHLESTAHPLHLGALAHFGPAPTAGGQEPPDVLGLLARRAAAQVPGAAVEELLHDAGAGGAEGL